LKKILHIPNYYPPHIGGIEDVCHSIVAGLPEYRHAVICFNDCRETSDELYEGVRVVRCGVIKKLFSQSLSLSFPQELIKLFREFQPDIVHFHTPNPLASLYLLQNLPPNVRLIVHWHSDIVEQGFLYRFYKPIEKRLLKRAETIIATSPAYIDGSKPLSEWQDKVIPIQNTINIAKLTPTEADTYKIADIRKQYEGRKILFTFGRHVPYKGLHSLLDAATLISPEAVIIIAGKGPLTDSLKADCKTDNVVFPGRLNETDLRCYLYASDIFIFPSITRNEAFGIALAEAMYCGLPSVTYTIPASGVNWVCPDGETGLEIENRNPEALASAVNLLLADEALRKKMGENAANRARQFFLIEAIKPKLQEIYDTI